MAKKFTYEVIERMVDRLESNGVIQLQETEGKPVEVLPLSASLMVFTKK